MMPHTLSSEIVLLSMMTFYFGTKLYFIFNIKEGEELTVHYTFYNI